MSFLLSSNTIILSLVLGSTILQPVFSQPVEEVVASTQQRRSSAEAWAQKNNYPTQSAQKSLLDSSLDQWGLVGFTDKPLYYSTMNANAAISTAADTVRQTAPFNASGSGLSVGIWDGGVVLETHDEVTSRVVNLDASLLSAHGTHVGGTLAATGINPLAKGMAPEALILSADYFDDFAELASYAAQTPTEALLNSQKITVSNHSYGDAVGWINNVNFSGNTGVHWVDDITNRTDPDFGRYGEFARDWDLLAEAFPYWLPFISAGNDRDDAAPGAGITFYYFDSATETWLSAVYDPMVHPFSDFSKGGYDTIITTNGGKNVMTVGAVNDAVNAGVRSLPNATMAGFSAWGPMDDGRIKPDIVANGIGLLSLRSNANDTYLNSSGTSMSSPNAAGSALLLQDYYSQLHGEVMPASMLKGLILHTADNLGRPGPDYEFGWGLMNTHAAAEVIRAQQLGTNSRLIEGTVSPSNPVQTYTFGFTNAEPLRATLCWVDPAGAIITGLDNPTPALVHDLDLRLEDVGNATTYFPYKLDPLNPTAVATTGDNVVDNVEQVFVSTPAASGTVKVTVSYKGLLTLPQQKFSLIITGAISGSEVGDWQVIE